MPGLKSLVAPSVQEFQQLVLVGVQLLQRLALDARDHSCDTAPKVPHLRRPPHTIYTMRKIRTVFGTIEVKTPRRMLCQRCLPHISMPFTVLGKICPNRATPELMELTARLGSMLPHRKAAEVLAEFLPIEPTEGHQTVRKRTLTLGARLEEQSLRRERESPPLACERSQLELGMLDDPLREFVVSVDTAHIRSADPKTARDFEIVIAPCGRGGRGSPPEVSHLVIISRRPTPPSLKRGQGRRKPFNSKDIPDTERSPFSRMARKS